MWSFGIDCLVRTLRKNQGYKAISNAEREQNPGSERMMSFLFFQ